ncbi:MAG: hypothetical protein HYV13_02365 [Candidatus Doudnabacteria bacterium]|nr:hypothetical protein [Candidatus Doudnabacteria bacterium]
MATFYKKNRSERFLYQLYVAGLYPVPYAMGQAAYREQSPGGIIVFNLNDKEGKNFTFEWEHLRPASFPGLTYDTAKEGRFIESLGRREGLLYRTKQDIKESFAERFKGYIDMNDLSKYHQEISKEDLTGLVRVIIRRRFLAQEIIARALELLGKQS